jgi:hypothetical protein
MSSRAAAVALVVVAVSLLGGRAHAQVRPTSGDPSVLSGRTLGNGQVLLSGGLGWPGFYAQATFAPSSRFNLGVRGAVDYGSPLLGLGTGVGGDLSVPMRLLVYASGITDIAVAARPFAVLGEGSLVGQTQFFSDDFGYGLGTDLETRAGFQVSDSVTLTVGAGTTFAYVNVPDTSDGSHALGAFYGIAAVEAAVGDNMLMFVELDGGYGITKGRLFDGHGVLRLALGVAWLL